MFLNRNPTSSVPPCHCLGWWAFTVTHQTTRSSPQLLFPPFLTYNLSALYLYSLIHLPPAPHPPPPIIQSSILSLPYFSGHFPRALIRSSVSLSLPVIHCCARLGSPLTFPLVLAAVCEAASPPFQVCRIATVCTSITLFALPFKIFFPFRQIAVFTVYISPFQPPPPGPFFPILLFFLFPGANIS